MFLGHRCQTDLYGIGKIIEDFTPCGIVGGAAAVAFVDNDHIEEAGGDIFKLLLIKGGRLFHTVCLCFQRLVALYRRAWIEQHALAA